MQGWFMAGSDPDDYELGIDATATREGRSSAFVASKATKSEGFGTMMQMFTGEEYRGKRMRIRCQVKSADVKGWAGLWMRVDGPQEGKHLAFDNMQNRAIKGTTDWQSYEVVLDVAPEATAIAFGVLLNGAGKVWLNDFRFEEVSNEVKTTSTKKGLPTSPSNLDFSQT